MKLASVDRALKELQNDTLFVRLCLTDLLRGVSLRDFVQMWKCKCHAPWWEVYACSHTIKNSCTVMQIYEDGKFKHLQ